jgi:hypothetical protein
MAQRSIWLCVLLLASAALVAGCELGKVDQGRIIAFDETKGTVSLIQDKDANPGKPNYDTLPPHVYTIPKDPDERGPEPKVGKRMKLDDQAKEITIFDDKTQAFYSARQRIPVTFTVPEEELIRPADAWEAGDEVRIYYKEPGKPLRLMNISKTDIFKK